MRPLRVGLAGILLLLVVANVCLFRLSQRTAAFERRTAAFSTQVSTYVRESSEFHSRATQAVTLLADSVNETTPPVADPKEKKKNNRP